jgi:hypothetical protein
MESLPSDERRRLAEIASRALHIQWVSGNAEKAEQSFFKINTEGTPLDSIEELLLKNRQRPIAIAARAVIRAGHGHKYWSAFESAVAQQIEQAAAELHGTLFEPEIKRPVRTLDFPLGGSKGVRAALEVLIEFMLIAVRDHHGKPAKIQDSMEDEDGSGTIHVLSKARRLAGRITGNDRGSLGLHPAVYFYGPSGVHSGPLFMGTVALIGRKLANNDSGFFKTFTSVRRRLEDVLIGHKDLIATILQKRSSRARTGLYEKLLDDIVKRLSRDGLVDEDWLVRSAGLSGKILTGHQRTTAADFALNVKSEAFITTALKGAPCCPICGGYLDPEKSLSYDHVQRRQDGGVGDIANVQLVHPYCNQSVKC